MTEIQNNPKEAGVLRNSKFKITISKLKRQGRAWIPSFDGMTERDSWDDGKKKII